MLRLVFQRWRNIIVILVVVAATIEISGTFVLMCRTILTNSQSNVFKQVQATRLRPQKILVFGSVPKTGYPTHLDLRRRTY